MRVRNLLGICAVALSACAHPNFYPFEYNLELLGPAQPDDLSKMHQVFGSLGFQLTSEPNTEIDRSSVGPRRLLEIWKLSSRQSTQVDLFRNELRDSYSIQFTDFDTGGRDLVGEPCVKFQELVHVLKDKFRSQPSRLKSLTESC